MFIRVNKTKNKKTNKEYIAHKLVESYKTKDGNVKQRVIMNLGRLEIPRSKWVELAYLLEQRISGQNTFISSDPELERVADEHFSHMGYVKSKQTNDEVRDQTREFVKIDLNSVSTTESRSLGAELVSNVMWEKLGFEDILANVGMNEKQQSLSKAMILGKLLHPSSERETIQWFQERTSMIEMTPISLVGLGKDSFYEIGDILLAHKQEIEKQLRDKERTLFSIEYRVFLYDLTNTYLEGSAKSNEIAKFGKSKEKRIDCPLVTLALVVDYLGFPVFSQIYSGNQSEPKTLGDVLNSLQEDGREYLDGQLPTLVMDRGIATRDNIALLNEKGYSYTVIERRPVEKEYEPEYKELKQILESETSEDNLSDKGWLKVPSSSEVYVKKVDCGNTSRILGYSLSREKKEQSIDTLKETRFLTDLENLKASIEKGNIVVPEKIGERIGKLKNKHAFISRYYEIELLYTEDEKRVTALNYSKKPMRLQKSILNGCYVIETTHTHQKPEEVWKDYMTLTRVEGAFRDLKSELGIRPIYHQTAERTKAHLFIGVLAYHLLVSLEHTLRNHQDYREWKTIKSVLSTHQRTTVILPGEDNVVHHVRVSGMPEPEHKKIYAVFQMKNMLTRKKWKVQTRL